MDSNEARARELLAAEWERLGWRREADMLRQGTHPVDNSAYDKRTVAGFRAITAALSQQPGVPEGWRVRWHADGRSITFQGPDSSSAMIVPPHSSMFPLLYAMVTAAPQPGKEG